MRTFVLFALTFAGIAALADDATAGIFRRNRGGSAATTMPAASSCECSGASAVYPAGTPGTVWNATMMPNTMPSSMPATTMSGKASTIQATDGQVYTLGSDGKLLRWFVAANHPRRVHHPAVLQPRHDPWELLPVRRVPGERVRQLLCVPGRRLRPAVLRQLIRQPGRWHFATDHARRVQAAALHAVASLVRLQALFLRPGETLFSPGRTHFEFERRVAAPLPAGMLVAARRVSRWTDHRGRRGKPVRVRRRAAAVFGQNLGLLPLRSAAGRPPEVRYEP